MNHLLEIAENTDDSVTREMACFLLPNYQGLLQMALTMIQPEIRKKQDYDEQEKCLLRKMKKMLKGEFKISDRINDQKESFAILVEGKNKEPIEQLQKTLMEVLEIQEEVDGIEFYERKYEKYDLKDPIYIEEEDGTITTLEKHSQLKIDLRTEKKYGIYMIPVLLEEQQIPEEKILTARKLLEQYQKEITEQVR